MEFTKDLEIALDKAKQEYKSLVAAKETLNAKDLYEIREYAKSRTNLSTPDEDLPNEEKAWKILYYVIDEEFGKLIGADKKAEIDSLEQKRDDKVALKNLIGQKLQKDKGQDRGKVVFAASLIAGVIITWFFFR